MKKTYYIFFIVCFSINSLTVNAQMKNIWSKTDKTDSVDDLLERKYIVTNYKIITLDLQGLKERLKDISKGGDNLFEFPDVQGNLVTFTIKKTSLLHPILTKKFPTINSYQGKSIGNTSSTIHFTVDNFGLHAMILSSNQSTVFIDPYTKDRKEYIVYSKKDTERKNVFKCLTKGKLVDKIEKHSKKNADDLKLRTFRLALATTEEYSNFHIQAAGIGAGSTRNDSINAVMSAIAVTMVRVNAIFERDVALTMQLVPANDQLIFLETDAGNDPYTNNNGPAMLTQNQNTINTIIGFANYDIGHVFSTGGGGVAFLGSPCGNHKAKGVTGSNVPVGDSFDIDFVTHEMGHQFGAHHTFNGTASNCGGSNRNNFTAVEPGSGSTIMGYAGICAPQNIQSNSDAYFHSVSIKEIVDNITSGSSQCGVETSFISNLNAPSANAGNDYIIPKSTPFVLKGEGFDADGDELTYCWEQIDNEVAGISIPPSSTQVNGAVFRSLYPSLNKDRFLPTISTVLSGDISSTWEVVPKVSRTMSFELTVRDNALKEGQTASDDMEVTVDENAGPFKVTSQDVQGISWNIGDTKIITWDVAGTDANSINVSDVNILLSLDGGHSFSEVLASNTPNDGEEQITVPNVQSSNVRVMVEAVNNIFYDINKETLSIGSFETTCTSYDSLDIPKHIPDNNEGGITSVITVNDNFIVTDVNVMVDISHTWIWDVQIYLEDPNGTEVLIYDRSCGASNVERININAVFDDDAASVVCNNSNPAISGVTKPDNQLTLFDGVSSLGDWKIKVIDKSSGDTGVINNWSIQLCKTDATASINHFLFRKFIVYPNPFNNKVTISLEADTLDDVIITLYDISGRIVYYEKNTNVNAIFKKELNFNNLARGMYILNVQKGIAKTSTKIIKY